ncbi:uncharacterized protein LOC129808538 [Phlebotomus papatasi]|uniref:uncharacterized protein LOC129808538 n=1 Tax=Phlebotomus papatasi TaxID=29031 RepID=UPI002483F19F|nr:uncharacterized protein LOC129808538 [Phlebotomus papatasi]
MFRQINLHEDDRNYHRILWRDDTREAVKEYQLNTVTYGTGPATYLSVRVLKQLAIDEGDKYPKAANILQQDFYVDDMLTGADSQEEAEEIYIQITKLMALGQMNIRKWTSNSMELMQKIPEESREKGIIQIKEDETIKPLGIHWSPTRDEFQYTIKFSHDKQWIKRGILSKIASIFDPTGWLAPTILRAKINMQALWKENIGWDEKPSQTFIKHWIEFCEDIINIQKIRIPRWTRYKPGATIELHGFSDASRLAYAACVYVRIIYKNRVTISLIAAKTRVAPIKGNITIPRMELCGAVLLANLMKTTEEALDMKISKKYAWCDSQITLAWIDKDPSTWQTYIANRVNKIHQCTPREIWNYIASDENPADIASRGITADALVGCKLWWRGPRWLRHDEEEWPVNNQDEALLELEKTMMKANNSPFAN